MQHSLVAWVTSFCAPEEDAEPTISCFQQGTTRPDCTKPAGQSQPLGVAFSTLCLLRVGEDQAHTTQEKLCGWTVVIVF